MGSAAQYGFTFNSSKARAGKVIIVQTKICNKRYFLKKLNQSKMTGIEKNRDI